MKKPEIHATKMHNQQIRRSKPVNQCNNNQRLETKIKAKSKQKQRKRLEKITIKETCFEALLEYQSCHLGIGDFGAFSGELQVGSVCCRK